MENFLKAVTDVNGEINTFIWGIPGLVLLIGTGILLTCCTKVFQVTRLG